MTSARALYDFGNRYNITGMTWNPKEVGESYPVPSADQTLMFAEAMMAYVMSCNIPDSVTCNRTEAYQWLDIALEHFEWGSVSSLCCACSLDCTNTLNNTICPAKSRQAPCVNLHCAHTALQGVVTTLCCFACFLCSHQHTSQ